MESEQPMDRLICGDVGFENRNCHTGRIQSHHGKQTAVLVPTTTLATQHYHTFRERLANFPVKVDYLSRARSSKEQKLFERTERRRNRYHYRHTSLGRKRCKVSRSGLADY